VRRTGSGPARLTAALLSPGGTRARLSILIYHRVLPTVDPLLPDVPDAATFRWQMEGVARLFTVLPPTEAAARLAAGRLPARAACISFDDGYADNLMVAFPILRDLGLPAAFFIATDYLDGGMMFNDRIIETVRRLPEGPIDLSAVGLGPRRVGPMGERAALAQEIIRAVRHLGPRQRAERVARLCALQREPLPAGLMLSTARLRRLAAAGMEIGGHTRSHPILTRLPDKQAAAEMGGGREILEGILHQPVRLFAYPNGRPGADYDARHTAMARACGFTAAFSTAAGVSRRDRDPYQLARFTPWDRTPARFTGRLLRNLLRSRPPAV